MQIRQDRPVRSLGAVVSDHWRNSPGASEAALMVNIGGRPRCSRRLGGPANRNSLSPPTPPRRGGRAWWAHLTFTRINITPTILPKQVEENLKAAIFGGFASACMLLRRWVGLLKEPQVSGNRTELHHWRAQWCAHGSVRDDGTIGISYALSCASTRSSARLIHYSRCLGSDGWRHLGGPRCTSRPVRQDLLGATVWTEVMRLLEDQTVIQQELDRRLAV